MSSETTAPQPPPLEDKEYVKVVESRARLQNLRAEEKLKNIDDLADAIFAARKSYRSKNSDDQ